MVMPTVGAFIWDFFLGISFVMGPTIALPQKKVSAWKRALLMLVIILILSTIDIVQKQDPGELWSYIALFSTAGVLEMAALILGTVYSEGSIYKRTVVNVFTVIFTSALVFAGTAFSESAREVMAAETTARDSGGMGYAIVCTVQMIACVVAALFVRLLLKKLKSDGKIYKVLFILGMLYDLVGVPARGYINYKSRHGEPKRDDVMIILGITYLLMTLSYIVVIAIAVNISKTAEAHGVGKNIKKRRMMEKKIMSEFVQEGEASEDGVDEAVSAISDELKRRGMVLELLCDMDEVRSRLGEKTVRLKDELEFVGEMLCNAKGEGGYMTICVRPLGDTMMLMCETRFKEGIDEHGSKTITRVL